MGLSLNSEWKTPDSSMPYNHVTWLCTHNAHSATAYYFPLYRQQDWNVSQALRYGVRAIMLDTYDEGFTLSAWFKNQGEKGLAWTEDELDAFIDEEIKERVKKYLPEQAAQLKKNMSFIKEKAKAYLKGLFNTPGELTKLVDKEGAAIIEGLLVTTDHIAVMVSDPVQKAKAIKEYGEKVVQSTEQNISSVKTNVQAVVDSLAKFDEDAKKDIATAVNDIAKKWKDMLPSIPSTPSAPSTPRVPTRRGF